MNGIFNNIVRRKYFHTWMNYTNQRLLRRITVLKHGNHIIKLELRIYLSYWRQQLAVEHENIKKTVKALIHWSSKLSRKMFIRWVQYSQEKTRKMIRYKQAMELHKSFILRQGLRTLLLKGVEEIVWRNEEAKKNAHQNKNIMFRYFSKWRHSVHKSDKHVPLQENCLKFPHLLSEKILQTRTNMNQKYMLKPIRFPNTRRSEPKIPGFLHVQKYC